MNFDEIIYGIVTLIVFALIAYAIWWPVSRVYYYFKYGSTDPIFREKD